MKTVTAVLIGAGMRGAQVYAGYASEYPNELKIVAVADPDPKRKAEMAYLHKIPEKMQFCSYEEALAKSRLADCAIIGTQDRMHFTPVIRALEKGYHVLCEKPMSPVKEEIIQMGEMAEKYGRILSICHVLRYSKDVENIESARRDFFDGKSAVYFNGVWESDILSESSIMNEMGYACYPMDNGKSLSYISPSSGYVVADSQDKRKMEACIRFIKYILSDSVQMKFALETSQASSNPRIDQEDLIKQRPLLGNAIDVANQADYHIKTIYSLWNEKCANVILRYVKKKDFNNDRLIVDLNKAFHH